MKTLEKGLLVLSIVLTVFVLVLLPRSPKETFGSVNQGNSFHSTSTRIVAGTALTSPTVLNTGSGDLGSVVITGAGTGIINIYDGTSTAAHSDYATTTLATFPASTAAGTYTFDIQYYKGLVIEIVGSAATSTITYR